jgi:hypothetical protein
MRIAMWSGPRNLSTAMMYAFGNRADFAAWDEPFYAAYLAASGLDHPMRDAILAAGETEPERVAARCLAPIPEGRPHFYMKHMPHHMLPGFPLDWAEDCVNIHLIRHPARVVASYSAKREEPTPDDIGFRQQAELYDRIGGLVIDSADVREDPEGMLRGLCAAIDLPFDPAMLRWPAGPKPFDGAWAPHWYGSVHQSTGFAGPEDPLPLLDGWDAELVAAALPHYEALRRHAMRPAV